MGPVMVLPTAIALSGFHCILDLVNVGQPDNNMDFIIIKANEVGATKLFVTCSIWS